MNGLKNWYVQIGNDELTLCIHLYSQNPQQEKKERKIKQTHKQAHKAQHRQATKAYVSATRLKWLAAFAANSEHKLFSLATYLCKNLAVRPSIRDWIGKKLKLHWPL